MPRQDRSSGYSHRIFDLLPHWQIKGIFTATKNYRVDITGLPCKRYHMSEPLADSKVSHWPQLFAILERKFERAEVRKGVSSDTSRRNSHLGLDPGQKPTRSSQSFWALAQHRCQAPPGGASSERPSVSAPGSVQDARTRCRSATH